MRLERAHVLAAVVLIALTSSLGAHCERHRGTVMAAASNGSTVEDSETVDEMDGHDRHTRNVPLLTRSIDIRATVEPAAGAIDASMRLVLDKRDSGPAKMLLHPNVEIVSVADEEGAPIRFEREAGSDYLGLLDLPAGSHVLTVSTTALFADPAFWLAHVDASGGVLAGLGAWYPRADLHRADGDVRLELATPPGYMTVASQPLLRRTTDSDGSAHAVFEGASGGTGVSIVIGDYEALESRTEHSAVEVYTTRDTRHRASDFLSELERAVRFLEALLGPVPGGTLAVAEGVGWPDQQGKGYGSLVVIAPEAFLQDSSPALPKGVDVQFLSHEIAHAWFGEHVPAPNRIFFSESIAQYLSMLYLRERMGLELAAVFRRSLVEQYLAVAQAMGDGVLAEASYGQDGYFPAYYKGPVVLQMLEDWVGEETLRGALAALVENFAGREPLFEELEVLLSEAADRSVTDFFERWVHSSGIPTIAVSAPESTGGPYWLLHSSGLAVGQPVEVEVSYEDGRIERLRLEATGEDVRFLEGADSRPQQVQLDPDRRLLVRIATEE